MTRVRRICRAVSYAAAQLSTNNGEMGDASTVKIRGPVVSVRGVVGDKPRRDTRDDEDVAHLSSTPSPFYTVQTQMQTRSSAYTRTLSDLASGSSSLDARDDVSGYGGDAEGETCATSTHKPDLLSVSSSRGWRARSIPSPSSASVRGSNAPSVNPVRRVAIMRRVHKPPRRVDLSRVLRVANRIRGAPI